MTTSEPESPDGCGAQLLIFGAYVAGWLVTVAGIEVAVRFSSLFGIPAGIDGQFVTEVASVPLCWCGGIAGEWLALRWHGTRGWRWPRLRTAVAGGFSGAAACGPPLQTAAVFLP